jgi:TrmH family RNA methyltransferase
VTDHDSISSPTNARFRFLKALWTAKGIREGEACLVGGAKLVLEVLASRPADVTAIVAAGGEPLERELEDQIAAARCPVWTLAPDLFREIDESMTKRPLAVVKVPDLPACGPSEFPLGPCLVLPLQSPENLGAAVRSALAFGIEEIVLTAESAHPYLPRAVRGSAGAVLRAKFRRGPKLAELTPPAARALVLDGGGQPLHAVAAAEGGMPIWIVGVEGGGVPPSLKGLTRVSVPTSTAVESLNATVALSIALYHWSQHR